MFSCQPQYFSVFNTLDQTCSVVSIDSDMLSLTVAGLLFTALYFYFTRTFDYWTKRGVKHDKPIPLFGTNIKNFLMRASVAGTAAETYRKYPGEQLVGFFRGTSPELVIRDPELAKLILIRDFNMFHRRRLAGPVATLEPLLKNQAFADDDLWRLLRLRTSAVFTSGKLKAMFPHIEKRAESLQTRLKALASENHSIDARDLMMRFTNDIIGSVAFGVHTDSLNNDNDPMRQLGAKIFSLNFSRVFNQTLKNFMPSVFGHLKTCGSIEKDVIEMVQSVMRQRNYEPSGRKDFMDVLLEAKKLGTMTGDSIVEVNADGTPKKVSIEIDDAIMAAQSFVFFVAGFEASSTTSSYTLNELAHNSRIQEKVHEEIDRVLARHGNKLSYDAIFEMTYLSWCINESMRLYLPSGVLRRESVKPYTFPGTNVTIDAGIKVLIPSEAYQNDPKIFPEPQEFRPERFDPAVITAKQKLAFLPFGAGPRACNGARFGIMQIMTGVAAVLSQFSVKPVPGAPRRPRANPVSFVFTQIDGGVPLVFRERQR